MYKRFVIFAFLIFAAITLTTSAKAAEKNGFARLDHVTASKALPNGIEVRSGEATLVVTALREDVLRVRISATSELGEDASWAVLDEARKSQVAVKAANSEDAVGFTTAKLRVTIKRNPLEMTITDLDGHVISADLPGRPVEFHAGEFRAYKTSPPDEHYFGLGDKPGPLDRRNEAFSDWNTDAFGWQETTDPIYKSIPFFITFNKGVSAGVFLDNTWRASFDFNKEYRDGYSFGSVGGALDYYVFLGPEPKQVVETWAWLTGKTPLPPMWSLGFQQSRYSYYPEAEARRIASRLRAERIPVDVMYFDIDYQVHNRPFTVDAERFPHFDQLISDLKAQNIRTVLITDLHLAYLPNAGYKPYDEGAAGDHFIKNADGSTYVGVVWPGKAVFPDFTDKSARDWWGTLYKDFVSRGIAGFWNDMNEPAIFEVASKTMPDDVQHRINEPGFAKRVANQLEIHNVYGMENSRGTYEGLLKISPDTRPFVLTRASYAGGQRYAATWSGDNSATWNHLRQTTPQLINLGLSGFAMTGADVGGFARSPQPALLTRWLQVAAFHPIDRDHSANDTFQQEPWENGTQHDVALRREAIEERYRLLPYIYTVAEEMSRTGLPMMRPLFLEFPRGAADGGPLDGTDSNSFMLGDKLLIADSPYPDTPDTYAVALPSVGWYDYWTGATVGASGGRKAIDNTIVKQEEVKITPNPDVLPVYVKAGSIVPEQPLIQSTMEKPVGPLTLRVYPPVKAGGECSGSLYLDDGVSFAFQKGEYLRVSFTCSVGADGVTVKVSPREGKFAPWWSEFAVEIYGAMGEAKSAQTAKGALQTSFDSEHHRTRAVVADDGSGMELKVNY